MGPVPRDAFSFALGIWFELLVYGVYVSLFVRSMWILLVRSSTENKPSKKKFITALIFIFIVATFHMIINSFRLFQAFVYSVEAAGPVAYFFDFSRWESMTHLVVTTAVMWLGDIFMIHRCFLVWNRNYYIIALPIILVSLGVGSGSWLLYWTIRPSEIQYHLREFTFWLNLMYPLHFVQNVLTTGLISMKIYKQYRYSSASGIIYSGSQLSHLYLILIIIEGAFLYTSELLILIILVALGSPAMYIFQSMMVPSIGIVFVLITVRVYGANASNELPDDPQNMPTLPMWDSDQSRICDANSRGRSIELGAVTSLSNTELQQPIKVLTLNSSHSII